MEGKTYYGNQPKEIDAAYIDQLLSAPVVPKKEPEPQPEPEPVVSEPPAPAEPAAKPFPKPLLLLIAIALLGVGFLLGWLARGDREVQGAASTNTSTTAPTYDFGYIYTEPSTDSGIAVDYASMSTKQLTDIAIEIPELISFAGVADYLHLTVQSYETLKSKYPVLGELEQRPDAVEQLTFYNLVISSVRGHPAAPALIEYYVNHLGFDRYPPAIEMVPDCEWVLQENDLFTVYEYTASPEVYFMMDMDTSGVTTVFNFDGCEFYLPGNLDIPADNANFWYRIEYTPKDLFVSSVPDPAPELTWFTPINSAWAAYHRCENGWFVYGYTPLTTDLTFTFYPSGNRQDIPLTVTPELKEVTDPAALAQIIFDQAGTLMELSYINPVKDLAGYPIVAQLLEQPDGISLLLNLTQKNLPSIFSSTIDFRFSNALSLLDLPAFQNRMRSAEHLAYQALTIGGYDYISCENLSEPAIAETPEGFTLTFIHGYHVGTPTGEPLSVPLSEMNFWAYVPLSDGAKILYQDSWFLNARFGEDSYPVIFWPIYNSLTGQMNGWIVCGKSEAHTSLQLELKQTQSMYLQSLQLDPRILDT